MTLPICPVPCPSITTLQTAVNFPRQISNTIFNIKLRCPFVPSPMLNVVIDALVGVYVLASCPYRYTEVSYSCTCTYASCLRSKFQARNQAPLTPIVPALEQASDCHTLANMLEDVNGLVSIIPCCAGPMTFCIGGGSEDSDRKDYLGKLHGEAEIGVEDVM